MSTLSLNSFGADSAKKEEKKNKALRFRSYNIESLEISKCQLTVEIVPLVKALLTACCSVQTLTL